MRAPKVGAGIPAAEFWRERSSRYANAVAGSYHTHRIAVMDKLIGNCPFTPGMSVLDFGCGEGVFLEKLISAGYKGFGIDPSAELIALARKNSATPAHYSIGGVAELQSYDDGQFDLVTAINVIGYFTDPEEKSFYGEIARILKPGGSLITAHSNRLFDLYTLNQRTIEFIADEFSGPESLDRLTTLVTHPDEPKRPSYNIRENPLIYKDKLQGYGFEEQQMEFINHHPMPPLLMDKTHMEDPSKRVFADTLNWPKAERWKLMFTCSIFGSRAVRSAS
jgi:2-polyprenyl-3-methyl-5-hydroxy-6-metoxy-1,4-benzoquinol methylase